VACVSMLVVALSGRGATTTRAQQVHAIASTLRCPVCKDLSAADSPAPLARQMRAQIRQQLDRGRTPGAIRDGFVTAYGPSVLMSPPDHGWGRAARWTPVALLGGAILGGAGLVRRGLRARTGTLEHAGAAAAATGDAPPAPSLTPAARLRQLDDLEDDLAAGRITEQDYLVLRARLEPPAVAAAARRRTSPRPSPAPRRPEPSGERPTRPHLGRWAVGVAVAAGAATCVGALLAVAVGERGPGPEPSAGASAGQGQGAAKAPGRGTSGGGERLSADQISAVDAAVQEVRRSPRRAAAHVDLAHAYTGAHQPQLAAIEYVAATRLDPTNPEANTALALVAFKAGNAKQAEALVTRALRRHPGYPEALYTRGLIRAMGLKHPAAAAEDLEAYQRVAPTGAHGTTVATVLALLASGAIR